MTKLETHPEYVIDNEFFITNNAYLWKLENKIHSSYCSLSYLYNYEKECDFDEAFKVSGILLCKL